MVLTYILFAVGLLILIKGADLLVEGAAAVARRMSVSDIVIGLTIVSFGTSAPELFVNIYASLNDSTDLAIGNIIGSNIANIFLILGIAASITPLTVQKNTVWKEIPLGLLAAVLVLIMASDSFLDGASATAISRSDGLILICFFTVFLYYTFDLSFSHRETVDNIPQARMPVWKSVVWILLGLTGLTLGGKWIVDGAITIARGFDISESVIGLTVVAVGTSLPELATSAVAAWRGNADIAIGNVVGSNIFNVFWIMGVSASISSLPFSIASLPDIFTNILASLLLFLFLFIGKKHILQRWQGILFLVCYVGYTVWLIGRQ